MEICVKKMLLHQAKRANFVALDFVGSMYLLKNMDVEIKLKKWLNNSLGSSLWNKIWVKNPLVKLNKIKLGKSQITKLKLVSNKEKLNRKKKKMNEFFSFFFILII